MKKIKKNWYDSFPDAKEIAKEERKYKTTKSKSEKIKIIGHLCSKIVRDISIKERRKP